MNSQILEGWMLEVIQLFVSFLIKLTSTATAVTVATTIISAATASVIPMLLLEPWIALAAIIAISATVAAVCCTVLCGPYVRSIGKFQLSFRDIGQLALDSIIMHSFFVPVAISKLHVVCNGIGKALALLRI